MTVLGDRPEVWRNDTDGGNWLRVKLEGTSDRGYASVSDRNGASRPRLRGYASSNLDALHFGLGEAADVPEVEIIWPTGQRQTIRNVKAGQTLVVREPARP